MTRDNRSALREVGTPGLRRLLTVATKSNAQRHAMVMWDEIAADVAGEFPDVTSDKMLVDAMTMRMVLRPQTLDTIVAIPGLNPGTACRHPLRPGGGAGGLDASCKRRADLAPDESPVETGVDP